MVVEGKEASANCTYVAFPNHTQKGRRTKCNEPLMRLVKLSNGDEKLYPYKLYCYKPITETIKRFLRRKHFVQFCNSWRQRNIPTDMYFDVYDGQVWKDFNTEKYSNFLASDHSFGLMLNLDFISAFSTRKILYWCNICCSSQPTQTFTIQIRKCHSHRYNSRYGQGTQYKYICQTTC